MEQPLSSPREAFIWNGCLAGKHYGTVGGKITHTVKYSITETVAGTEHNDEHENTPEHPKSSKKSPHFVAFEGAVDLLPFISIEHPFFIIIRHAMQSPA
jgi:hypothetical protein